MKKVKACCLIGLLAIGLVPSAASAATETQSRDVYVTYQEPEAPEVISVDITWGSLTFKYEENRTWNPTSHTYDATGGAWKHDEGANLITITNHSNAAVAADLTLDTEATYKDALTIKSDKSEFSLATAAAGDSLGDPTKGPKESAALSIEGKLSSAAKESTVVGHVTVQMK